MASTGPSGPRCQGLRKRVASLRSGGRQAPFYGHALAGVRVDGPSGRGFLRGLSLTRLTVSRSKGRPFYGQAMGQLRLTCTFSAECAQREGCGGRPSRRRGAIMIKPYNRASPVGKQANRPAGGEIHPFCLWHLSTGKHVTGFSDRFTPLQIQFLCHPGGGGFGDATPHDAYEITAYQSFIVPLCTSCIGCASRAK